MADAVSTYRIVPKKFYRYFLKGLSYYTFRLNRACTLRELQAYVFVKSLEKLNEAELTAMSEDVMEQLVSTGVAHLNGGCYRLTELLRPENSEPAERNTAIDPAEPPASSKPAKVGMAVKFSNVVTIWDIGETVNLELPASRGREEEEDDSINASGGVTDTSSDDEQDTIVDYENSEQLSK